jgi:hypothetical protein
MSNILRCLQMDAQEEQKNPRSSIDEIDDFVISEDSMCQHMRRCICKCWLGIKTSTCIHMTQL